MLHQGILPYHAKWHRMMKRLRHVVVDEVHTYRGVMGSHMAMVFRRLLRLCEYYGARPTFIFCSATIGNPGEIASALTGQPFEVVETDGAPRTRRDVLLADCHRCGNLYVQDALALDRGECPPCRLDRSPGLAGLT